jgi:serine/threonine protein kinase
VHRDVKTENMLLDKTRTVKIADFGVARVEASNPSDMTGETGTLGYMAPEVCLIFNHCFSLVCDYKDDTRTPTIKCAHASTRKPPKHKPKIGILGINHKAHTKVHRVNLKASTSI